MVIKIRLNYLKYRYGNVFDDNKHSKKIKGVH